MVETREHGGVSNGLDQNPVIIVIGNKRIRDGETTRGVPEGVEPVPGSAARDEFDAIPQRCGAGEIADGAVLDRQGLAGVEDDSVAAAEADPLDGETAQADLIGCG